jgi:uncharacterized protein
MTPTVAVALFGAAVLANALGAALGMAGGIFVVPALTTIARVPLPTAVAVSLVSVVACSCASSPHFLRAGIAHLRLAVVLELATASGAFAGVLLTGVLPDPVLYGLFTAVLVVSAGQLLRRRTDAATAAPPRSDLDLRLRLAGPGGPRVHRIPVGWGLMFGAGLLSTLLGIGSGVLKIPAMDLALRLPLRMSSATANLMIGVTAAGGAAAFLVRGQVDPRLAAPVVLGSVAGSLLGAPLLTRVPVPLLRTVFATVLIGLAALTTLATTGTGPFR